MTDSIKALKEKNDEILRELTVMADGVKGDKEEFRSFTADELSKYDALNTELEHNRDRIATLERVSKLDKPEFRAQVRQAEKTRPNLDYAFKAWLCNQGGLHKICKEEYRSSAEKLGIDIHSNSFTIPLHSAGDEYRDQSLTGTDHSSYLLNSNIVQPIELALKAYGGIRNAARFIQTNTGENFSYPCYNNTANKASIISELDAITNTTRTFTKVALPVWKYQSGVFPIANELIRDGNGILPLMSDFVGEDIARGEEEDFAIGAGTTEPVGLFVGAASGLTTNSATDITFLELKTLFHSVDSAYRSDPSCAWVMNDATLLKVGSLLDGNGIPLWQTNMSDDYSYRIFGKPVIVCNDAPAATAGLKPIAFGAIKKAFIVRSVGEVEVSVLRELYKVSLDATAVVATHRAGSATVNANAVKVMTMHA